MKQIVQKCLVNMVHRLRWGKPSVIISDIMKIKIKIMYKSRNENLEQWIPRQETGLMKIIIKHLTKDGIPTKSGESFDKIVQQCRF